MAQVTVRKIVEGDSHVIIRVHMVSDVVGELHNYVLLSPSDLVPVRPNTATAFRITQAWYGCATFSLVLGYNTMAPAPVWTLPPNAGNHVDFRCFGGLTDYATSPPADVDGKLWVSTIGFNSAGSQGSLVLELRKTNSASAGTGGV